MHFLQIQKWPKSIFELGKLPKMQFREKNFLIYLISRLFLPGRFLNFLARCGVLSAGFKIHGILLRFQFHAQQ